MNTTQQLVIILVVAAGTVLTRFLPFWLFPDNRPTPKYVQYLGKVLPYSAMGLLLVYCLKDVTFTKYPFGAAEGTALLLIGLLHIWKKNLFLSIGAGTVVYMVLLNFF